jgi:DNA-directed RNA polymerase subunit RPC12/RpoP
MIRFGCEHCGHKISVQDKHVGKRGKCPECGALVVIPTKSTIITFHCQNCNRKISVPKTYASKEVQCPNCKDRFIVPAADLDIPLAAQSPPTQSAGSDGALTFLDLPKEYRVPNQSPGRSGRRIGYRTGPSVAHRYLSLSGKQAGTENPCHCRRHTAVH